VPAVSTLCLDPTVSLTCGASGPNWQKPKNLIGHSSKNLINFVGDSSGGTCFYVDPQMDQGGTFEFANLDFQIDGEGCTSAGSSRGIFFTGQSQLSPSWFSIRNSTFNVRSGASTCPSYGVYIGSTHSSQNIGFQNVQFILDGAEPSATGIKSTSLHSGAVFMDGVNVNTQNISSNDVVFFGVDRSLAGTPGWVNIQNSTFSGDKLVVFNGAGTEAPMPAFNFVDNVLNTFSNTPPSAYPISVSSGNGSNNFIYGNILKFNIGISKALFELTEHAGDGLMSRFKGNAVVHTGAGSFINIPDNMTAPGSILLNDNSFYSKHPTTGSGFVIQGQGSSVSPRIFINGDGSGTGAFGNRVCESTSDLTKGWSGVFDTVGIHGNFATPTLQQNISVGYGGDLYCPVP
jgi:hypothetical protein